MQVRKSRLQETSAQKVQINSSVRYSLLTKEEMMKRMKILHNEMIKIKKQRDRLMEKVRVKLQENAILLDQKSHDDMKTIIETEGQVFIEKEPMNSFQRVFWQQQVEAARCSDARGMRWHPLMIRWCIYLRHRSQGAYETLRESKCISLPSQRTLRDYTHHTKAKHGFSTDVDSQLCHAAGLEKSEELDKHVLLLLDEMHIKEDLVFDKHSGNNNYVAFLHYNNYKILGELIGFINLGDIKEHLQVLENTLTETSVPRELLANSMVTFMVRGLFTHLEFPYVYFPSRNLTGNSLFNPLWEAVSRLERYGFKVNNYAKKIQCNSLC